ncbi:hypothetical protein D9757_000026 [Collybiopsis confluens]|uniref:Uncharacterized protein n=1 Tax=Collybiopsis confluens TaxID=2823264 RepID=A0A8H5I220_9AGAR|nr:hypothetical protein D9757_000026 [Collybiopsis confluens]
MHHRASLVLLVLLVLTAVFAVPTFDGHNSIGSLIPGLSSLQALRQGQSKLSSALPSTSQSIQTGHSRKSVPRHVSVRGGTPFGNLTITSAAPEQGLFYVHKSRLWRFNNESSIHAVNVRNMSEEAPGTDQIPLQLVLDESPGSSQSSGFRWHGSMLIYEQGKNNNSGVYYECLLPRGGYGLLTFLQGVPTPRGCSLLTLHGFEHDV